MSKHLGDGGWEVITAARKRLSALHAELVMRPETPHEALDAVAHCYYLIADLSDYFTRISDGLEPDQAGTHVWKGVTLAGSADWWASELVRRLYGVEVKTPEH